MLRAARASVVYYICMVEPLQSSRRQLRRGAMTLGPLAVVGCAWATSGVRGSVGTANVALILAGITVAVALVTWVGGLVTSTTAALALNFFHTEPVHTLRISDAGDLLTVVLLGALGIGVSVTTVVRVRTAAIRSRHASSADATRELRALTSAQPVAELWSLAIDAIANQLELVDARIVTAGSTDLPLIARHRWNEADADHTLLLPEGGAVVAFADPRHRCEVVLAPRHGMGALSLDRRAVFAFVDQLALAMEVEP